jgi:DNA-directed RNA polymerase specialized sigma24 family protein
LGDAVSRPRHGSLDQELYEKLIEALDADRGRAVDRYEKLRRRLLKFFAWERAPFPEGCADATISRVAKRISDREQIHDLNACFHDVAALVLKESLEEEKQRRAGMEIAPAPLPVSNAEESETAFECLEQCLRRLSPSNQYMIVQYYHGERSRRTENRRALAKELGIPSNALRNRALRLRGKLEGCLRQCVQAGAGERDGMLPGDTGQQGGG